MTSGHLGGCQADRKKIFKKSVRYAVRRTPLVMRCFLVALAVSAAASVSAAPKTFDFKDPKEMNAISLSLDAPIEPMVGYAKGISGTLSFDPANPGSAAGTLTVDANSVQFASDGYTATARGYALNAQKYPQLVLKIRKVESVKRVSANEFRGVLLADFTCRGITRPKRMVVSATYWPGRAEERTNGSHKGDLLVVRTAFDVSRREHGISDGIPDAMVGDVVKVGVAVVGICYAPKPVEAKSAPRQKPPRHASKSREKATIGQPVDLDVSLTRIGAPGSLNLSTVKGSKGTVLFFLNEQCGVTYYYRSRMKKIQADFGNRFAFVGIRSGARQFPDRAIDLPETRSLAMPFVDDKDGALMARFGVGQSLTFAVLDAKGTLRYVGGFDDQVTESAVKRSYLRDALRDLAAGRQVRRTTGPAIGCAIIPPQAATDPNDEPSR